MEVHLLPKTSNTLKRKFDMKIETGDVNHIFANLHITRCIE